MPVPPLLFLCVATPHSTPTISTLPSRRFSLRPTLGAARWANIGTLRLLFALFPPPPLAAHRTNRTPHSTAWRRHAGWDLQPIPVVCVYITAHANSLDYAPRPLHTIPTFACDCVVSVSDARFWFAVYTSWLTLCRPQRWHSTVHTTTHCNRPVDAFPLRGVWLPTLRLTPHTCTAGRHYPFVWTAWRADAAPATPPHTTFPANFPTTAAVVRRCGRYRTPSPCRYPTFPSTLRALPTHLPLAVGRLLG